MLTPRISFDIFVKGAMFAKQQHEQPRLPSLLVLSSFGEMLSPCLYIPVDFSIWDCLKELKVALIMVNPNYVFLAAELYEKETNSHVLCVFQFGAFGTRKVACFLISKNAENEFEFVGYDSTKVADFITLPPWRFDSVVIETGKELYGN